MRLNGTDWIFTNRLIVLSLGRGGQSLTERFKLRCVPIFTVRHGSALGRVDQTTKGTWRMTWRQEAMKDVGTCEKLQGAGNQAVICRYLNGETHPQGYRILNA